jgi:hypothetical protein
MTKEYLKEYFKIYSKFLSRDLYISLRPITSRVDENGHKFNVGGRQTYLIYKFLEIFKLITISDADDKEIRTVLQNFSKVIDIYILHNENIELIPTLIVVQPEKVNDDILDLFINDSAIKNYNFLFDAMAMLQRHGSAYRDFYMQELKAKKVKKNIEDYHKLKTILTQGLIEFSNALSHMTYTVLYNSDDDNNIKKALTHIHRATLDNYKELIKNLELDDDCKKKLVKLRIAEFNSLGKDTTTKTKEDIIDDYKEVVTCLLSSFPTNAFIVNSNREQ